MRSDPLPRTGRFLRTSDAPLGPLRGPRTLIAGARNQPGLGLAWLLRSLMASKRRLSSGWLPRARGVVQSILSGQSIRGRWLSWRSTTDPWAGVVAFRERTPVWRVMHAHDAPAPRLGASRFAWSPPTPVRPPSSGKAVGSTTQTYVRRSDATAAGVAGAGRSDHPAVGLLDELHATAESHRAVSRQSSGYRLHNSGERSHLPQRAQSLVFAGPAARRPRDPGVAWVCGGVVVGSASW
jgi:hypothetical protein